MVIFNIAMVSSFKKYYFGKKCITFIFQLTGDYGCCSQWSVIRYAQFFLNNLLICLDKSVEWLYLTSQWSPVSKSTILGRNASLLDFQLTGDYGCCSQWSVIRYAQFFLNNLLICLDKSVEWLYLTSQWSPVSKSTILGRNASLLFFS